jgi:hypothetical protein
LIVAYVLLHYIFVSQTAHVLALFAVFLDVGITLGVPAGPLAFMLLFSHNLFSVITPQAASANLLFTGSGYLTQVSSIDTAASVRPSRSRSICSWRPLVDAGGPVVLDSIRSLLEQSPMLALFATIGIGYAIAGFRIAGSRSMSGACSSPASRSARSRRRPHRPRW